MKINQHCMCLMIAVLCNPVFNICICQNASGGMFRSNPQLTGATTENPVYSLKGIKFRVRMAGPIRGTPVVFKGSLYFGVGDGYFYSVNASSGAVQWKFKTDGAIYSSAAVSGANLFISSRDGYLYALQTSSGDLVWKFKMGNDLGEENYWDNILSSPIPEGNKLFIGSGDGNLYCIDLASGKQLWKYNSGARIRTTPAIFEKHVVFGNNAGIVTAINKSSGQPEWKFSTAGASNTFESRNNDRTSIYCSASIADGTVITGGRDGIVYALDLNTGKEKWRNDHKGPWILSTAIKDGIAFIGCGSDYLLQALDLKTGIEKWRMKTPSAIFSSITVAGNMLYFNDLNFSGNLHALNIVTGQEKWRFPMSSRSFSTPVIADGILYCGTEDGTMYALQGNTDVDSSTTQSKKYVFWQGRLGKNDYSDFQNGIDQFLRDYFIANGYLLVDHAQLEEIMKEQIGNPSPNVIVFADNRFPTNITDQSNGKPLVLKYLEAHGKIALLGLNPIAYTRDSAGLVTAYDDSIPGAVFGLKYVDKKFIRGIYASYPTDEGQKEGLLTSYTTISNFTVIKPGEGISSLAKDEFGSMTEWIKNFGGPVGTGLLQLNIPTNEVNYNLGEMRAVIEYGVCW